ncbi:MAG TPA: type II secretion system protein GspG [Thermoanaerobaculia bacterium]|nr:type II secretion system protein GspG [Thermoanaerobaculia bacterium]
MPYCAYCGAQVDTANGLPCPRCSNPKNGAPPRPITLAQPAPSSSNTPVIIIAVLVGGFAIVAIIGILAAIAIPNLLTAMQRAKQKRTMADMRTIGTAIEAYASDRREYPAAQDTAGLDQYLIPTYVRLVPRVDGWGRPFRYECWSASRTDKCDNYAIVSGGKNGIREHDSPREYAATPPAATTNFDCNIVYSNGTFIEYPEGIQRQ